MSKLLTENELAAEWGLSPWTVRRWRLSEGLPVCKVSGRFFYRLEAVTDWLKGFETTKGAADTEEEIVVGRIRQIRE